MARGSPPPSLVSCLSGDLVVISFIRGEAGRSCDNNKKKNRAKVLFVQTSYAVDNIIENQIRKQSKIIPQPCTTRVVAQGSRDKGKITQPVRPSWLGSTNGCWWSL